MPGERDGWFESLSTNVKVGAAAVAGLLAIGTGWYKFAGAQDDYRACSVSGVVFSQYNGRPTAGVRIGFDGLNPSNPSGRINFKTIADSGPDGSFKGNCHGAVKKGSFMLLYFGGPSGLAGLPCLEVKYSYIQVAARGTTDGVRVPDVGC